MLMGSKKANAIGSSTPTGPVHLSAPVETPANATPSFISSPTISVDGKPTGLEICSPIAIPNRSKCPIKVKLSSYLGPSFARGWKKLPDELKVDILAYNLRGSPAVAYQNLRSDTSWTAEIFKEFCRYLAMTPEIAALSREIYYSQNTFLLGPYPFRYPCHGVNLFIRRVHMTIPFTQRHWGFLVKLANGTYGFRNLQYIEIDTMNPGWQQTIESFQNNVSFVVVVFKCAGTVSFHEPVIGLWGGLAADELADLQQRVRGMITFSVREN